MNDFDEALKGAERLMDEILHPLYHFLCPACGLRFGLQLSDVRWFEQMREPIYCPRGHELRFGFPEDQPDGDDGG